MPTFRSITATALLAVAALVITAGTPRDASAFNWSQYLTGYGSYNYPQYWNNSHTYQPYNAYNAYGTWNGRYGGYYGTGNQYYNPYYNGHRNYYGQWRR